MNNTSDLAKFGYREIDMLADLLKAYASNPPDFFSDDVTYEFNPNSGLLFLVDGDLNVGVLEDAKVVQFYSCPECGNEGTQGDGEYDFEKYNGYCSRKCEEANE